MGWRRLETQVAVGATVAVVILMGVYAVLAVRARARNGGIGQFNACVVQTRFLVVAPHGQEVSAIDTIEDRTRRTVVGEVTANQSPANMLGGAAAENDGYLMSTATPTGRDAIAIEGCWDQTFQTTGS